MSFDPFDPPRDYGEFLMIVATALRDLSVAAVRAERQLVGTAPAPNGTVRRNLKRTNDYVEKVLELVVEREGDIRPRYLEGYSSEKTVGNEL